MPPSYRCYGRRTLLLDFDDDRAGADRRGAEDRLLVVLRCELRDDDRDTVWDRPEERLEDDRDTERDWLEELREDGRDTVRGWPE